MCTQTESEYSRIDPEDALQTYLRDRRSDDLSEATIRAHEYRLSHFVRWCADVVAVDSLDEVDAAALNEFAAWRQADGNLSRVSLHTQLSTLKVFVRWAGEEAYVSERLYEFVQPPKLRGREGVSEVFLDATDADAILDRFERFDYASAQHVAFLLMWVTGGRVGGVRGLDLDDYHSDRGAVEFRHRPDTDTPLKMAERGENVVSLSDTVTSVVDDYCQYNRLAVEDEYKRQPLVTTRDGRPHTTTLRDWCYAATRPCMFRNECPHDRDELACEATHSVSKAVSCPSSCSPHAVRKGSITFALRKAVDEDAVCARMNVSPNILGKHYDMRSAEEKMQARRDEFDAIY